MEFTVLLHVFSNHFLKVFQMKMTSFYGQFYCISTYHICLFNRSCHCRLVKVNAFYVAYDHIKTICAIIQQLFGQNKLITRFDGRRCIDD